MYPDDEDVNIVEMDKPFELSCGMVEINDVFTITLHASQATKIGNQLFNRLLDEGILVMQKITNEEGLEDICRPVPSIQRIPN